MTKKNLKIPLKDDKFSTTIIIRDDLETDQDLEEQIREDEQTRLLYQVLFFSSLILLLNLIAW